MVLSFLKKGLSTKVRTHERFFKNYDAITDSQLRSCVKLLESFCNAIKSHAGKEVYFIVES